MIIIDLLISTDKQMFLLSSVKYFDITTNQSGYLGKPPIAVTLNQLNLNFQPIRFECNLVMAVDQLTKNLFIEY